VKNKQAEKRRARLRRHHRVRGKVLGTAEKPRLSVFRSLNHIYAQIINDDAGETIASASSLKITLPPAGGSGGKDGEAGGKKPESIKIRRSKAVGKAIAEAAIGKGVTNVKFDRGGGLYHGRIAALADAAREAGLKF
jgi:large subunit ribosomal protein L18